jgi:hypothetical protein
MPWRRLRCPLSRDVADWDEAAGFPLETVAPQKVGERSQLALRPLLELSPCGICAVVLELREHVLENAEQLLTSESLVRSSVW